MSYDLTVFFPHVGFPAQAWHDLLEGFRGNGCIVRFDEPEPAANNGLQECSIVVDQSVVSIGVGLNRSQCAPKGTSWEASISTTMGRSARALFVQYAVP